jgi:hypothetical protein
MRPYIEKARELERALQQAGATVSSTPQAIPTGEPIK